jgi:hypothetical protein
VTQKAPWIIAGLAGAAVVGLLVTRRADGRVVHPDPRPGVTAERVLPPSMVSNAAGAAEAYAAARSAPHVLDGVHCYCECTRGFGHRSLLTCFESEHGSQCDICKGEATLAAQLASQGNTLDAVRRAIDQRFGS